MTPRLCSFQPPALHTLVALVAAVVLFHVAGWSQASSRREQIIQRRIDKRARIWDERTPGIIDKLNNFTQRGLLEGAQSTKGANGLQLVLGGMRSGNGASFGIGYRRVDIWGERVSVRATARGTAQKSYMFDIDVDFPRLSSERGSFSFYSKWENSPLMDYYGPGGGSFRANRSSYRLEDVSFDLKGRYRVWNRLFAGGSVGYYVPNTGPGKRDGFPTTGEKFTPEETPGLGVQPSLVRTSATLQYDYRDLASGPRDGGNYYATYWKYWDRNLHRHSYHQLDAAVEQYLPYRNKTHVAVLRLAGVLTYAEDGQSVPFFLQPTLGGNDYLRGFGWYRFYDQSSILFTAEHRWYLFPFGHAALFFDAGKVANKASQSNFHDLEYSGGIGFRFTLRDSVAMRVDNAVSREGYRLIWTLSSRY